ncbi:deazaflavin-dependent nitroreductase [Nocardia brasiliensis]|uniref:Deazaflavin-dependent nitroreductase n=1 Tax=Nocardia brasiliensis TaxID=37326 RepID=A0A6G9XZR2_NOCBR|nr:deazaflavin-dependent nitroreductase [Nocardia brasiliensis]QIS06411.1 deazaflavin-dependent nitroreductase [Nocardia brasiliensis]
MATKLGLPGWLKPMNRVVITLNRAGLRLGTMRVLSVPGRVSGELRTTPVSPLTVRGARYVVGHGEAEWVRNARKSHWGILAEGRRRNRVDLIELPADERPAVLRAFPQEVPHGVPFFIKLGLVNSADPDEFAAAAPRSAVFRIENPSAV